MIPSRRADLLSEVPRRAGDAQTSDELSALTRGFATCTMSNLLSGKPRRHVTECHIFERFRRLNRLRSRPSREARPTASRPERAGRCHRTSHLRAISLAQRPRGVESSSASGTGGEVSFRVSLRPCLGPLTPFTGSVQADGGRSLVARWHFTSSTRSPGGPSGKPIVISFRLAQPTPGR
jgi:hypothetical protein